jgi:hypothetical protein
VRSGLACSAVGQVVVVSGGLYPIVLRHRSSQCFVQGQWLGRCRIGRRWGRASQPVTLTMRRRSVAARATAWAPPASTPTARKYRTCTSDHGVGTRAAGRGMEPSASSEPTAFAPARVLPGRPGGLPAAGQRWARPRDTGIAPTPGHAAKLTRSQLRAAPKRSGRTRDFDTAIDRIQAVFWADYLRQRPQV